TERAVQLLGRAVELDPANPVLTGNYLDLLSRAGRSREAIAVGRSFLAEHTPNAHLHNALGRAHQKNGSPEDAAREYRKALELEPANAWYAGNLLGALYALMEYIEVIHTANAWVAQAGNIANMLFLRWVGLSYYRLNNLEKA